MFFYAHDNPKNTSSVQPWATLRDFVSSVMLAEFYLYISNYTWDHFIKHKIEIADAIIVFISFILDLVFLNDDAVGGLVGKCLGSVYY